MESGLATRQYHSDRKYDSESEIVASRDIKKKFLISELEEAREFPWNNVAKNLKSTIHTRQDQGPSGHRRVYLTTRVVARHGATRLAAVVVSVWDHTEACRVRLEKALADERTDPVEAPVGPNTKRANESQEPTPTATSSSPVLPRRCQQNFQNEQMDSLMELGPQEQRTQRSAAKRDANK